MLNESSLHEETNGNEHVAHIMAEVFILASGNNFTLDRACSDLAQGNGASRGAYSMAGLPSSILDNCAKLVPLLSIDGGSVCGES